MSGTVEAVLGGAAAPTFTYSTTRELSWWEYGVTQVADNPIGAGLFAANAVGSSTANDVLEAKYPLATTIGQSAEWVLGIGAIAKVGIRKVVSEGAENRFARMSSAERRALLEAKLELNAMRQLEAMQLATPGAHFVERHGAQLSLTSQLDRVAMGLNPTSGVLARTPLAATRFFSARDQLGAITRAEQIFANTGDRVLARQPIGFGRVIGEGYSRSLGYGTQTSAQVLVNTREGSYSLPAIWILIALWTTSLEI